MDDQYPHTNAFTRLAPSGIAGIGVFAIRDIPQGTNVFPNDALGIRWIDRAIIDNVDEAIAQLYAEFAIRRGDQYGCPANFNSMTVGWYLNEPSFGNCENVIVDSDYFFFAARDIGRGEELTVCYRNFSDPSS
jgi:SET domain-containing protein